MMGYYLVSVTHTGEVLDDVHDERRRQDRKWGEQNHPDGTKSDPVSEAHADCIRHRADEAARAGTLTWRHILDEEVAEAFAEDDPARLREELVQVAAVAVGWIEAIDRRENAA